MEPIPITGAQTVHPNNVQTRVPTQVYSDSMKNYKMFRRQRMIAARDARDQARPEYDDMPFLRYIEILKKADDQYIAPRKNAQDTSINTGTIRDKDTTIVEYLNKFEWEPVATCFDDNDEMQEEIAETGEDMVKKSLDLEDWAKAKAKRVYRSMTAFGTALVEDYWHERWTIEKQFGGAMGSDKSKWTDRQVKEASCQAKLWDIRKCYPGDIRKFFMNGPEGQPFFFTVEYESYDVVKQMFGQFDNWKYVPNTVVMTPEVSGAAQWSPWWTLRPVSLNYCEIVRYYDPIANEYSLSINDVDMLPIMEKANPLWIEGGPGERTLISGFPLTEVSPSSAIPFAKYDFEPMHDLFYSKGQPGKMRVLADVENMTLKLMIGMMKQQAKPTMGNKSGRNFGPEVTDPATVINDIREGDLFPVLPNFTGIQPATFSFYRQMKQELANNSVQDSFQGIDGSDQNPSRKTATQDMNDRGAQSLDIASAMDGVIYGNSQLYWFRTFNISRNWTKPVDVQIDVFNKTIENKYRTVTMPSEINGGQKATKKIVFTKNTPVRPGGKATLEDSMKVHQAELDTQKTGGGETRTTYLHPEQYASMRLMWSYTSIPVPNASDPLSYMVFSKQLNDAATFFGPQSLQVKRLKHRFAKLTGMDFDSWFLSQQELDQATQAAAQQAQTQQQQNGQPGVVPGKPVAGAPTAAGAVSGANPIAGMASMMK
jgi:hypothetical protein